MATEYPTADEWAEHMSEALLKPLREVGAMLAREIDNVNAELADLQRDVAELGRKVENLAVLAGGDEREHSVRVAPDCTHCGHAHVLHVDGGCHGVAVGGLRVACYCAGYHAPARVPVAT